MRCTIPPASENIPKSHPLLVADGALWPKSARWAFWALDSTSNTIGGACVFVQMEECGLGVWGLPSQGFPLQMPPWKGLVFLQLHQNCGAGQSGQGLVKLDGRFEDSFFPLTLNTRDFKNVCRLGISAGKSVNVPSTLCTLVPPGVCLLTTLEHFKCRLLAP